jgi:DNA adenine methylase
MKRPALDYFGGKWKKAKYIIQLFPPHKSFVEVFCGAASVTLKKPPSKNEIINDIHGEIVNFFRVLRERNEELQKLLLQTPYSRDEYYFCRQLCENPLEQARRTCVKSWFGIGDSLDNKTGFRVSLSQGGSTTQPWIYYIDHLHKYAARLRNVIIENLDYRELIKRYDKSDTLFYLDPPYLESTRSKKHAYKYDWSLKDHEELLAILPGIKGKFILSGYLDGPYNDLKFNRSEFSGTSQSNQATREFLWKNY